MHVNDGLTLLGKTPTGLISQVKRTEGRQIRLSGLPPFFYVHQWMKHMGKHTPLFDAHESAGARMVDFAGWDMPVNYGSQIDEHHAVRNDAGMFDVSHMSAVDISGAGVTDLLKILWANDITKASVPGKAIYTCMLNARGGVVDDLIAYHLDDSHYRVVVNAGTTDKDLAWIKAQARDFDVEVRHRDDLAIIAVQGPNARDKVVEVLDEDLAARAINLKPFYAAADEDWLVGRTGYTGEDGFEIILPADQAENLWQGLLKQDVTPCGLGARDTLRLEAGLNLYGQDMDEDRHPLESGLGWTVAWAPEDRRFIGREALEHARDIADTQVMVGLLLEGRGVMRSHQAVRCTDEEGEGEVTSGGYGPTLERSIGLARVPADWNGPVEVQIRNKWVAARIVKYPFVRHGKIKIDL